MEEKKPINIRLSTVILIFIIIALLGGVLYFAIKTNETEKMKEQSLIETQTLQSKINELENKIAETKNIEAVNATDVNNIKNSNTTDTSTNNKSNIDISKNSNEEDKIDVEWSGTEANYKKYNSNGYHCKIEGFSETYGDNIDIVVQIYKEIPLPSITQQQYKKLDNGETIKIDGMEMKKSKSYKGQHDLLIYYPTQTEDHGPFYYVDKNSDGTGKLEYADIIECKPTDKWMHFIVSEKLTYKDGKEKTTLKEKMHSDDEYGDGKESGLLVYHGYDRVLTVDNWKLNFKNGKCIEIEVPDGEHVMQYED